MNTIDIDTLNATLAEAYTIAERGNYIEGEPMIRNVLAALDTLEAHAQTPHEKIVALRLEALNDLAMVERQMQRFDESRIAAESAMALAKQTGNDEQHTRSLHILAIGYMHQKQYVQSEEYFTQALALSRKLGNDRMTANILSNFGANYHSQGEVEQALDYYAESLPLHEKVGNLYSLAITACYIGSMYDDLQQHEKSLEYNLRSLQLYDELGCVSDVGDMYNNVGFNYACLGNYEKARESYLRSIAIYEQQGSTIPLPSYAYTNLGDLLRQMELYEESFERLTAGLALLRRMGDPLQEGRTLAYLARLYATDNFAGASVDLSVQHTLEAIAVFEKIRDIEPRAAVELVKQHSLLAELYQRQGDFESALRHFTEYHHLDKAVRSESILAKSAQFEQKIAHATMRARAQATEELLHKTLPKSIADRVIQGETRIADHFDSASILFADVVGFTELSANLPPAVVLGFMNFIFEHFDAIAAQYGCERIKTIGDGYMAVCGAPVSYANHAERVALMSLDMMKDIHLPEEIREHLPEGTHFHLRIGLHCGEITAGLIGTGKLAYDIYGDAVNTASRMESHGEPGKIHVSEEFMHALSLSSLMSFTSFHFQERGEMEIKGKGIMRTFYLENRSRQ